MKNTIKKKATVARRRGAEAASVPAAGSVTQIRDILFGEQMTDYEGRFAELEANLEQKFSELKASLEASVSELRTLLDSEKQGINDRNVSREMLADQLTAIAGAIRQAK